MSITGKTKALMDEKDAEVAALNEALEASAQAQEELSTKITELEKKVAFQKEAIDEASALFIQKEKEAGADQTKIKELRASVVEAKAETEAVQATLVQAKAQLENPAFVAAAADGEEAFGNATGGEGAGNISAQYAAIKDPAERTAFYRTHKKEIQAAARG